MKVLITGGSGFIGSFIAEHLRDKGLDVVILTRNVKGCWRIADKSRFLFSEGDFFNPEFLRSAFKIHEPSIVIHCAWNGVAGDLRNDPIQVANLEATRRLFEISAEHKIKLFVGLGSQAEYGVYETKTNEDFQARPETLYGISKLAAGLMGKVYFSKYGFRYAWLRLFSVFGPKDNDNYVIPYVIKSLLNGNPPALTRCEQRLDYIYIKDLVQLIFNVINTDEHFCDIYNLCSGRALILKQVVLSINKLLGGRLEPLWGIVPYGENHQFYIDGENRKFIDRFGWTELKDTELSLLETINWYKEIQ